LPPRAVVLSARDNVATALDSLRAGECLELVFDGVTRAVTLRADIPFGHKFSLAEIRPDSPVIKYGEVIGLATAPIETGDYVHVHNIVSARARGDLAGGVR
jgi:altronate dehydratase small subunit